MTPPPLHVLAPPPAPQAAEGDARPPGWAVLAEAAELYVPKPLSQDPFLQEAAGAPAEGEPPHQPKLLASLCGAYSPEHKTTHLCRQAQPPQRRWTQHRALPWTGQSTPGPGAKETMGSILPRPRGGLDTRAHATHNARARSRTGNAQHNRSESAGRGEEDAGARRTAAPGIPHLPSARPWGKNGLRCPPLAGDGQSGPPSRVRSHCTSAGLILVAPKEPGPIIKAHVATPSRPREFCDEPPVTLPLAQLTTPWPWTWLGGGLGPEINGQLPALARATHSSASGPSKPRLHTQRPSACKPARRWGKRAGGGLGQSGVHGTRRDPAGCGPAGIRGGQISVFQAKRSRFLSEIPDF